MASYKNEEAPVSIPGLLDDSAGQRMLASAAPLRVFYTMI